MARRRQVRQYLEHRNTTVLHRRLAYAVLAVRAVSHGWTGEARRWFSEPCARGHWDMSLPHGCLSHVRSTGPVGTLSLLSSHGKGGRKTISINSCEQQAHENEFAANAVTSTDMACLRLCRSRNNFPRMCFQFGVPFNKWIAGPQMSPCTA